ncbi:MAG: hypothetical protein IIB00_00315 [candidate division Zixibacteria bacterium]|nr:hypothetical protein [candidate division Zixibacteria bacterium]
MKNIQDKIRQVAYDEAVATIIHQVNNPLSVILGEIELLEKNPHCANPDVKKRLAEIQKNARRIQLVTAELLSARASRTIDTPAGRMIDLGGISMKSGAIMTGASIDRIKNTG